MIRVAQHTLRNLFTVHQPNRKMYIRREVSGLVRLDHALSLLLNLLWVTAPNITIAPLQCTAEAYR
jgi:hypothetical protein